MATYAFIDGGHLRRHYHLSADKWFGTRGIIDYGQLRGVLGASRMFYYDAIDEVPLNEHDGQVDEQIKYEEQQSYLDMIASLDSTFVRQGRLTKKRKGKPRTQKEVDVFIAVDIMNHAARRNLDTAILLTGDLDFRPLVQAVVDMGTVVRLMGDRRATSGDLAFVADRYTPLSLPFYHTISEANIRNQFPLPAIDEIRPQHLGDPWVRVRSGHFSDTTVDVYIHGRTTVAHVTTGERCVRFEWRNETDRLYLYCEIEYPDLQWH